MEHFQKENLEFFRDRIHSDLFLEAAAFRMAEGERPEINMREFVRSGAEVTDICIETEEQSRFFGRKKGRYITVYAEQLRRDDGGMHREISELTGELLMSMIPAGAKKFFLAGLGNAEASPDALGPDTVSQVHVSRCAAGEERIEEKLIEKETMDKELTEKGTIEKKTIGEAAAVTTRNCEAGISSGKSGGIQICALSPGVMAQTGLETAEILEAVVDRVKPDVMIVIDALAAGSVTRLGTTIQITDTGIAPGAGIGNHRQTLDQDRLGIPVIAIGIPMVVEAAAVIYETIDAIRKVVTDKTEENEFLGQLTREEQYQLFRELLEEKAEPLYVTVKDVDALEKRLAFTLSEALNGVLLSYQENEADQ